jgi:archaetidylinositol phosphate synthase
MTEIEKHHRVLDTFTGPIEKPVLLWLAARMPDWVTSDMLTGLGTLGSILIFVSYWLTNKNVNFLWLACFGFFVNWFGDSLDGTLARYRKIERPKYGFFIDHVVDAYNEVLVFLGLAVSPFVRFELATLALIGYLLLSILVYITTCVMGEFRISYGKLGPTEARLIAVSANILVFFVGNPKIKLLGVTTTVYDWVAIIVIGILAIILATTTISRARSLSKIDPR